MAIDTLPVNVITIPDILANWKWPRWNLNPHYEACKAESQAWIESFHAFSPKRQDAWNRCDFSLIAALAYPYYDKQRCRAVCDLMGLFWIIDEFTDHADEQEALEMLDIVMSSLSEFQTRRPKGEWVGGEVARQYRESIAKFATPRGQARFLETFKEHLYSVVEQARDRKHATIQDLESYFAVRRITIGLIPCIVVHEFDLVYLTDEVVRHPVIEKILLLGAEMMSIANDIYSYNVEQSQGNERHNAITIIMIQHPELTIQEAIEHLYERHLDLERQWDDHWARVPRYGGPIDRDLAQYLDGVAYWVRANVTWSFETVRYFGKKGLEIEKTRKMKLLPKINKAYVEAGVQLIDDTLI